jgi:Tol biopolymer transport system component
MQLSWYDRSGRPQGTVGPPDLYFDPALSPDGSRLAVGVRHGPNARIARISVLDLVRGSSTVLTQESGPYVSPVWSRDGRFVLFSSGPVFPPTELHRHAADGSGTDEVLFKADGPFVAQEVSPDGRSLACLTADQKTSIDIRLLSLDGDATLTDLVKTPKPDTNARFSPDGRWLAYRTDDPAPALYVQAHPPTGARWQVASAGVQPQWRADGKELFYLAPDRRLMGVTIETTTSGLRAGEARELFQTQVSNPERSFNSYVAAPDGQRFLVATPRNEGGPVAFTVVLNWSADLGR